MFTGALAASYYGSPRTTMDIYVMVKVSQKSMKTHLVTPLRKAGIRANERKIGEAFQSGFRIVTLKDERTPFTVDIILSDRKLRKKSGTIVGLPTFYQIPEDLILSKLRMIKATVPKERALKDKDDVRAILRYGRVNLKILKKQAQEQGTLTVLQELTKERVNS